MKKVLVSFVALLLIVTMVTPALAAVVVPSIERKQPGRTKPQKTSAGTTQDYLLYEDDSHSKEIDANSYNKDDTVKLIITPLSKKNSAAVVEIKDSLETAKSEADKAKSVPDLCDISVALKNLKKYSTNAAVKAIIEDDYVIDQLFDASLIKNEKQFIAYDETGAKRIGIKFETDYKEEDGVLVLIRTRDGKWKTVESSLAADGTLSVFTDELGVMAFIKADNSINPHGDSDQTGDNTGIIVAIMACAATMLCIGGCLLVDRSGRR